FARMVRNLARELGKQARLEIQGPGTYVDRDILEKLEAPLTHLLRRRRCDRRYRPIAQDQSTSAVYGMPKAAAPLNAASEILPLQKIGPRLRELFCSDVKRTLSKRRGS